MGHKVHPNGFRLGVSRTWNAKWYADEGLHRPAQGGHRRSASLVDRAAGQRQRPLGRDRARHQPRDRHGPHRQAGHRHRQGRRERRGPAPADRQAHHAQGQAGDQGDPPAGARRVLVAANIAQQLPRRIAFRKAIKQAIQRTMKAGAKGVQHRRSRAASAAPRWLAASGTGKGASRWARCAPTSATARCTPTRPTARIGVKVWIYRGDIPPERRRREAAAAAAGRGRRGLSRC